MSVTAHKTNHIFQVSYKNLVVELRDLSVGLQTETLAWITTEALNIIEVEYEGDTKVLRAQKVGRNTFVAVGGST